MLQQTQVARAAPAFERFVARFPDIRSLADAPEQDVLAAWSGLGYYGRARRLRAAASEIVARFGGLVPADPEQLRSLPGVGPYTAGAIASLAFDRPEPAVDGNVARIVLRIDARRAAPDDRAAQRHAWDRARGLVSAADRPGDLNEALMDLGATVCTPQAPRCEACPLAGRCAARLAGVAGEIPLPSRKPAVALVHHAAVVVRDSRGRMLVERRGDRGLWAGIWQAPTLERASPPRPKTLAGWLGVAPPTRTDAFTHRTTHREVRFSVWLARPIPGRRPLRGRWMTGREIARLPLGVPQRRILLGEA